MKRVARGLVVAMLAFAVVGCFGSGGRCDPPATEDLVGAVSRVDLGGRTVSTFTVEYVADVVVRAGVLMTVNEAGEQTQVSLAQGPRRRAPAGLRTFGTRLQGVHGQRVVWTQEGAGGVGIGSVGTVAVVLGEDRQLRGVGLHDGTLVWNSRLEHRLVAHDARLIGNRAVLAGQKLSPGEPTGPAAVAALDAESGAAVWLVLLPELDGPLLTARAGVVVVAAGDRLVALDQGDGRKLWVTDLELPGEQVLKAIDVDGESFVAVTTQETFGCD